MGKSHSPKDRCRVRTHHWNNGRLNVKHHYFNTYDDAILFCRVYDCDSYKIYNYLEILICTGVPEHKHHHHHHHHHHHPYM